MDLEASYYLSTSLHYNAGRLDVTETITITNRSAAAIDALHLSVLARALGELRVRSVRVDGVTPRVSYPNRADMLVALPGALEPATPATRSTARRPASRSTSRPTVT
jgi:hypothetical protein